jgi:hypothetical protein
MSKADAAAGGWLQADPKLDRSHVVKGAGGLVRPSIARASQHTADNDGGVDVQSACRDERSTAVCSSLRWCEQPVLRSGCRSELTP